MQLRSPSASRLPFRLALALGLVLFFAGGAYSGYLFYATARAIITQAPMPDPFDPLGVVRAGPFGNQEVPTPADAVDFSERVNILLLGVDQREGEQGPWRTDTMILASIDPQTKSAGILSIPRDLWVYIPYPEPGQENRINTAHFYGDAFDYPGGGGAGLAMRTVAHNFGVTVHHYVRLDFDGFRRIVDTLGGVDIFVEDEITDYRYPTTDFGYTTIHIPAGQVHMDGEMALQYARTRATMGADFDRGKRQLKLLVALRERALSINILPRLPTLITQMPGVVDTNLGVGQMLALARIGSQIPSENVKRVPIDTTMTTDATMSDGARVLWPCRDLVGSCTSTIGQAVSALLSPPEHILLAGEKTPEELRAEENATVLLENGTLTPGLAEQTYLFLQERGYNVVQYGNADRFDYRETLLFAYGPTPFTVDGLEELFGLQPGQIISGQGGPAEIDIRIVLGTDFSLPDSR